MSLGLLYLASLKKSYVDVNDSTNDSLSLKKKTYSTIYVSMSIKFS